MREITFRGKRLDDGMWEYGDLTRDTYDKNDYETGEDFYINGYPVDESTIGQFTGLCDKKCISIYEGDILAIKSDEHLFRSVVMWDNENGRWIARSNGNFLISGKESFGKRRIIDNIHDNPELMIN